MQHKLILRVLETARELVNTPGRWCIGHYTTGRWTEDGLPGDGYARVCAVGALMMAARRHHCSSLGPSLGSALDYVPEEAHSVLAKAAHRLTGRPDPITVNDAHGFSSVKAMFDLAVQMAEVAAKAEERNDLMLVLCPDTRKILEAA